MNDLLARVAVIAVIAGGFAATGDLGWLVGRTTKLLDARTIPGATAGDPPSATPVATAEASPMPAAAPEKPVRPPAPPVPVTSPQALGTPAPLPPSGGGPDRVDFAALAPGDRVRVWAGLSSRGGRPRCLVLDVVDPASGEALAHGDGIAPRRVMLSAGAGGTIVRGRPLALAVAGIARDPAATASPWGTIDAVAVERR